MAYLKWLTIFVWLPLFVLWATHFRILWKFKRTISFCVFWALVFSIPWDLWAIHTQIWIFPSDTNVGIWIGGIPLEEYFFIVFVTMLISTITLILRERAHHLLVEEERKEKKREEER